MSNRLSNIGIPPKPWRPPRAAADIATGVWISHTYGRLIAPVDVARVLTSADVRFVIVGTHAVNAYSGQPRATADVDVIVRSPKAAAKAVAAAFPALNMREISAGTRFADEKLEAIDIIHPRLSALFRRLLKEPRHVRIEDIPLPIPTLEGVLASKFHAMHMSVRSQGDRSLDAADFMRVVDSNPRIDLHQLAELGELIAAGGGAKIVQCVADARAERRLDF